MQHTLYIKFNYKNRICGIIEYDAILCVLTIHILLTLLLPLVVRLRMSCVVTQ